jgi:hypothetical protein
VNTRLWGPNKPAELQARPRPRWVAFSTCQTLRVFWLVIADPRHHPKLFALNFGVWCAPLGILVSTTRDWNVKGNVGKLRPTIGPRVTGVGPGYQRFVAKKEPYMQR